MNERRMPSGDIYGEREIAFILKMASHETVRFHTTAVTLNSGLRSHFTIECRDEVTDRPWYALEMGSVIAERIARSSIDDSNEQCLIGIPMAGQILASAASVASYVTPPEYQRAPLAYRILRKQPKEGHGVDRGKWVIGRPDYTRYTYWVVDNVFTTGKALFEETAPQLIEDGYIPSEMNCFILANRNPQCGRMVKEVFKNIVIGFELIDLVTVLVDCGIWPRRHLTYLKSELRVFPSPVR